MVVEMKYVIGFIMFDDYLEVLVYFGIDMVDLKGVLFMVKVVVGDDV